MTIDWNFISRCEGGCHTTGYVPAAATSKSGVTIATGVDIGQRSVGDVGRWPIPEALKARLVLYCGLTGAAAKDALARRPLTVSAEEARLLDEVVAEPLLRTLIGNYNAATAEGSFEALPGGIQTALASVAFQYGPYLAKRTPKFWAAATAADWPRSVAELENFGDAYPTRRRSEAALIRKAIGAA